VQEDELVDSGFRGIGDRAYGAGTTFHESRTVPAPADLEGGLASLREDGARTVPRRMGREADDEAVAFGFPAGSRGVSVPPSAVRLVAGMSEYGSVRAAG